MYAYGICENQLRVGVWQYIHAMKRINTTRQNNGRAMIYLYGEYNIFNRILTLMNITTFCGYVGDRIRLSMMPRTPAVFAFSLAANIQSKSK